MTRILTAGVGIPLVLGITWWSPDWLFAAAVAVVSVLALEEFLTLAAARGLVRPGRWVLVPGAALVMSFERGSDWVVAALAASVIAVLAGELIVGGGHGSTDRLSTAMAGLVYACMLLGFVIWLPRMGVFVLLGVVWAGDIAAYYFGRLLGRRRLAPEISPGKTVEGAVAGTLASIAVGVVAGAILLGSPPLKMAGVAGLTGIAAQVGDLGESALKRAARLKDSSRLLPGHGGMLDRIDGLLFAAPVFYGLMLL